MADSKPEVVDPAPPQAPGVSITGIGGKSEFFAGCSYEERDGGLVLIRNGENVDFRAKGQWKPESIVVHS
jgi:hypothetical protein